MIPDYFGTFQDILFFSKNFGKNRPRRDSNPRPPAHEPGVGTTGPGGRPPGGPRENSIWPQLLIESESRGESFAKMHGITAFADLTTTGMPTIFFPDVQRTPDGRTKITTDHP